MGIRDLKVTYHVLDFTIKAALQPRTWPWSKSPTLPMQRTVPMPFELILLILDIAGYNERHGIDKRTLQACSLVCKMWTIPSQTLLFRHVRIHSGRACTSFLNTSTPHLREAVKTLLVSLDYRHPDPVCPSALAKLLNQCPNLHAVDMAVYSDCEVSFDEESCMALRRARFSNLRLANWSSSPALLGQLMHVWPDIKTLSLSGHPSTFVADRSHDLPALKTLSLNARPSASVEFLQWLLSGSSNTLRAIEFDRMPQSDTLSYITETYGSQLSYLALPSCTQEPHSEALRHCVALEGFKLEAPTNPPFMVWKELPSSVKMIGLGINENNSLHSFVEMVRRSKSLTTVVAHLWDGAEQNPNLASLKIACAMGGVDLKFTRELRHFRELTKP